MVEKDQKGSDEEPEEKVVAEATVSGAPDENAELKDRLLRMAAEFDNYKKRVAKEIDASKDAGRIDLLRKILPTLDEFELAIKAIGKGEEHAKGIELVYMNLVKALKSAGLKEIEVDGTFDPYKHEIMVAQDSDKKEGTVLEVIRKGYIFNDIVIRPAAVVVAKEKVDTKQNENKQGE